MSKKKKQQHRDDDKQKRPPEQARQVGGMVPGQAHSHRSIESVKDAGDNPDGGEPMPGHTGVQDMYPGGGRG